MSASVSVIIPYFNDSATIARALKSALNQTLLPCEVIVSDDCSDVSESLELRKSVENVLAPSQVPIRIVQSVDNGGPASARNAGWREARGSWVAFLDADDSWGPQKLERQLQLADRNPSVVLWGAQGVKLSHHDTDATAPTPVGDPEVAWVTSPKVLFGNPFITSGAIVRRTTSLRFDESMRFSEDYDLWIRIVCATGAAGIVVERHVVSYKKAFGESGLSASLFKMEWGALRAIWRAPVAWRTSAVVMPFAIGYSLLRFIRRVGLNVRSNSGRTGRQRSQSDP